MLSQVGELSIAAGDNHRFVVAKRLKYEAKSNAASLLAALLQHPAYRDATLTPGSGRHDNVDMHGPFILSDIGLEDFGPIDARSAQQAIEVFWADESHGLPKPGATEKVRHLIRELDLDHAKTLRLEKSGVSHEYEPSSLHDAFQEFVIINPEQHVVTLLVLGID
ncbi:MAG TPA: hypothetical protein VGV60_18580 [Candidatus Polarisedimenticolia bacterium]|jgi:hypothetical protein|nr:hypothetical protein [Candidatus Polarisedimenticolia bacterium]